MATAASPGRRLGWARAGRAGEGRGPPGPGPGPRPGPRPARPPQATCVLEWASTATGRPSSSVTRFRHQRHAAGPAHQQHRVGALSGPTPPTGRSGGRGRPCAAPPRRHHPLQLGPHDAGLAGAPGRTTGTVAWVSDDRASLASTAAARTWASPGSSAGSSSPAWGSGRPWSARRGRGPPGPCPRRPAGRRPGGDPTISNDVADLRSRVASKVPPPRSYTASRAPAGTRCWEA